MHKISCLIIVLIILSCNQQSGVKDYQNQIKIKKINDFSTFMTNVKDLSFVKLETNDSVLIGNISKAIYYDDKFFILDFLHSKTLFCFSSKGKSLFKINNVGKGPGEFIQPSTFWIEEIESNYRIIIHDGFSKKILRYDSRGKFINEKWNGNHIFKDCFQIGESIVTQYQWSGLKKNKYNLKIIKSDFSQIVFDGFKTESEFEKWYCSGRLSNSKSKNEVLFSYGVKDEIFVISSGGIKDSYHVDFGEKKIPDHIIKGYKFNREETEKIVPKIEGYYSFIHNLCNNDERMAFSFLDMKNLHFCIIDKKNNNMICYKNPIERSMSPFPAPIDIKENDNNVFISYLYASDIESYQKKGFLKDIQISENNNPIFVFYKIDL